jgi:DNA (cytosine-5)-methyltransferase 1
LLASAVKKQEKRLCSLNVLFKHRREYDLSDIRFAMHAFYEFFAGGGMARAGLGSGWTCLFANDFDPKKAESYATNWGDEHLRVGDVASVTAADLPGRADLAWASFPCQDLSLAGAYRGLKGERSGVFWAFWKLMLALRAEGRAPRMIALENVTGLLTSNGGSDFRVLVTALTDAGYRVGAAVIDAVHFVPQSRPRLFIVAVDVSVVIPADVRGEPTQPWHPDALHRAQAELSDQAKDNWVWWRLPQPPLRNVKFVDVIEREPIGVRWHTKEETQRLLGMMTPLNRRKVEVAERASSILQAPVVGGIYRRTRGGVQRAEVRFDDVSGCLRTPRGGSSRQMLAVIENGVIRTRLLSPREAARLMGLPDSYKLPANYNQAYHLCGDGVAVPAVRFLAEQVIEPLLKRELSVAGQA